MIEIEEDGVDQYLFDPLNIIEKYKNGVVRQSEIKPTLDDSWRKLIPTIIKNQIVDWQTETIQNVYDQAKIIMSKSKGEKWADIMAFVSELSQVIYDLNEYKRRIRKKERYRNLLMISQEIL